MVPGNTSRKVGSEDGRRGRSERGLDEGSLHCGSAELSPAGGSGRQIALHRHLRVILHRVTLIHPQPPLSARASSKDTVSLECGTCTAAVRPGDTDRVQT